jgi:hypothetical protein
VNAILPQVIKVSEATVTNLIFFLASIILDCYEKRNNSSLLPYHNGKNWGSTFSNSEALSVVASYPYRDSYPSNYAFLPGSKNRSKSDILGNYPEFMVPISRGQV